MFIAPRCRIWGVRPVVADLRKQTVVALFIERPIESNTPDLTGRNAIMYLGARRLFHSLSIAPSYPGAAFESTPWHGTLSPAMGCLAQAASAAALITAAALPFFLTTETTGAETETFAAPGEK